MSHRGSKCWLFKPHAYHNPVPLAFARRPSPFKQRGLPQGRCLSIALEAGWKYPPSRMAQVHTLEHSGVQVPRACHRACTSQKPMVQDMNMEGLELLTLQETILAWHSDLMYRLAGYKVTG